MSASELEALVWRSVGIASALLVGITCLALYVRHKWPTLAIRVITSVILLGAFLVSPPLVDALFTRGRQARETGFGPGYVIVDLGAVASWLPAALMVLAGAGYSLFLKRARMRS